MGTIILDSVVIPGNGKTDSTINICAQAVKEVISKSGVDKKEIDLLINIGMNRDKNVAEPAIAALIQKEAKLNVNPTRKRLSARLATFSFDLMHGANGFLYAVDVVNSFFKTGIMKKAIIVSSEIHPSGRRQDDFPYKHYASAVLLEYSENSEVGFQHLKFNVSNDAGEGLSAYCNTEIEGGRYHVGFEFEENFAEKVEKFTIDTINQLLETKELDFSKTKHIITSTPSEKYGRHVSDALGFKNNTLVDVLADYGDTYTTAPLIGYHEAVTQGIIKKNEQILFVCGGAGLSCSFGIYKT